MPPQTKKMRKTKKKKMAKKTTTRQPPRWQRDPLWQRFADDLCAMTTEEMEEMFRVEVEIIDLTFD